MRWSLPLGRFSARRSVNLRAPARRSRSLRSELLEARQLLALTFMGDLNPEFEAAEVDYMLADGDRLYFSLETAAEGKELWTSDGTAEGTHLVKDLIPGPEGWEPRPLLAHDGLVYFTTAKMGAEASFWRTDGTSAGTVMLSPEFGGETVVFQDEVYFSRFGDYEFRGLWRTNGTPDDAERVYFTYGAIAQLTPFGDALAFVLHDNSLLGSELWKYNPATNDASLVRDIFTGADSGFHESFWGGITAYDDVLYFTATNGLTGRELWRSDGTWNGTYLLAEFNPGQAHGFAYGDRVQIAGLGSHLFVVAEDGIHGREVWRVDTLTGAAEMTADLVPVGSSGEQVDEPNFVGVFDSALLFQVSSDTYASHLMKIDEAGSIATVRAGVKFAIGLPAIAGDSLYYLQDSPDGAKLVRRTSLSETPLMLADVDGRVPRFATSNQALYFTNAEEEEGKVRLWKSNGTADGTAPFTEELTAEPENSYPSRPFTVGESLFFLTNGNTFNGNVWLIRPEFPSAKEVRFATSDGCTPECPVRVSALVAADDDRGLYFLGVALDAGKSGLWRADELGQNVQFVAPDVTTTRSGIPVVGQLNDSLLFFRRDSNRRVSRLEKTNADGAGYSTIKEFAEGAFFQPSYTADFHGSKNFMMVTGSVTQLWRTDGTTDGTQLVRELPQYNSLIALAVANDKLFVSVSGDEENRGLWAGDGTLAGSTRVTSDYVLNPSVTPTGVYFAGFDAAHGRELWFSDGVTAGLVADLRPGVAGSLDDFPHQEMLLFKNQVYLVAKSSTGQLDIWRTNGTAAGTELFFADVESSFGEVNGTLFFQRATAEHGQELWQYDGVPGHATLIADMYPGPTSSFAGIYANVAGTLYLFADTPAYGWELWRLTLDPGDTNYDKVVNLQDLNNVRNNFGDSGLGDTNGDGVVNIVDLNAVRNHLLGGATDSRTATPRQERFDRAESARDAVFAMHATAEWRTERRVTKRRA